MSEVARTHQMLYLLDHGENVDWSEYRDLLLQPTLVGSKSLISASVIDQDHRETFASAGLLLRTPAQNILDTNYQAMGSNFANPHGEILTSTRQIYSVNKLMRYTGSGPLYSNYNEVRLLGETDAGLVEIVGFWAKVNSSGIFLNETTARQVEKHARQLGLPFVPIIEGKLVVYEDGPPQIIPTSHDLKRQDLSALCINRRRQRYIVDIKHDNFSVLNERAERRTMSPDEFSFALQIIKAELNYARIIVTNEEPDPAIKEKISAELERMQERHEEFQRRSEQKNQN